MLAGPTKRAKPFRAAQRGGLTQPLTDELWELLLMSGIRTGAMSSPIAQLLLYKKGLFPVIPTPEGLCAWRESNPAAQLLGWTLAA